MMIKKILLKKLYNKPISAEVESRHSVKVSNLLNIESWKKNIFTTDRKERDIFVKFESLRKQSKC